MGMMLERQMEAFENGLRADRALWRAHKIADDWIARAGIPADRPPNNLDEANKWNSLLSQIISIGFGEDEGSDLPDRLIRAIHATQGDDLDRVLQVLSQRKSRVHEELRLLSAREQISEIRDAVEAKVEDEQVRQELSDLVSEIQRRQEELDAKLESEEAEATREMRKIEIQERRWQLRKSILEREPAAVVIGGLLLIVIAVALLIAMFTHTAVPEIVSSAFLLILGFFFGQSTGSKGKPSSDGQ